MFYHRKEPILYVWFAIGQCVYVVNKIPEKKTDIITCIYIYIS